MQSRTHIIAFLLALLVAAALTPLVRRLAEHFKLYDEPDVERKVHQTPIPRLGGIAMAIAFFTPLVGLLIHDNDISRLLTSDPDQLLALFGGGIAILLVGIVDDVWGVRARNKLVVQIVIAFGMVMSGVVIERFSLPFFGIVELGPWVATGVTVFWFVAIINAVNLIDGLDGLAGGVALFAVVTMYVVASLDPVSNLLTTLLAAALAGSIIGFLFYNFNPATIFMGDCGSMFLGFVIASAAVQTQAKSSTAVALTVCVLALGLPVLDTAMSIVRRIRKGRPVFDADREHIHHRLLALGFTQRQAMVILYGVCGLLAVFALAVKMEAGHGAMQLAILVGLGVVLFALGRLFQLRERLHQRRIEHLLADSIALPHDARLQIRELSRKIRMEADTRLAWDEVRKAADVLRVRDVRLRLHLRPRQGEKIALEYSLYRDDAHFSQLPHEEMELPLMGRVLVYGDLQIAFRTVGGAEDEERRVLLHLLAEALADHIEEHLVSGREDRFVVRRIPVSDESAESGAGG
jgi:UDP-GlcNAc:undecaprenyl-phosphate GlcNAc-1-phosphate transferase